MRKELCLSCYFVHPSFFSTSHHDLYAFPLPSPPPLSLSPHPLLPSLHSVFTQPPHLNSPLHLVTMQIYLSPLTRKTGSSEDAKLAVRVPTSSGSTAKPHTAGGSKPQGRKTPPSFSLNLKKNTNIQHTVQDECVYKSPVKSPSQYFQICYWTILRSLNKLKCIYGLDGCTNSALWNWKYPTLYLKMVKFQLTSVGFLTHWLCDCRGKPCSMCHTSCLVSRAVCSLVVSVWNSTFCMTSIEDVPEKGSF